MHGNIAVGRDRNIVDKLGGRSNGEAREAGRFKRYPDQAREQGREGVVVVVVTTVAGVPIPQVRLSQSSGSDLLDKAALELLEIAVQTATLPESLRGQQFGLTLPIHYRLDD